MALTVGKVAEILTSPDRQRVVLADGSVIDARLLVVATGHSEAVRRAVGVERVDIQRRIRCRSDWTLRSRRRSLALAPSPSTRGASATAFPF